MHAQRSSNMPTQEWFDHLRLCLFTILTIVPMLSASFAQCPISPSMGTKAEEWDAIFAQDGPGKGLQVAGAPAWTGGDSTYSILLPNGDTAFFFSDSYIGESPKAKGDGTVTRSSSGLRTTEINCAPPICDPPGSIFIARNSIVVLDKSRKHMRLFAGPKNENGISTSYFKDPAAGLNFWMGDAIVLQKKRLLVFLHKFDPKLAFHGAAIAQLNPKTLAIEKQIDVSGFPSMDIHWGTAMIVDGEWLYIYGKGARGGKKQVFVARAKADASIDELAISANWSVWDGSSWTSGLQNAGPIIPPTDSISDEFNVVRLKINGRPTYVFAGIDTTAPWGSWRDITLYSSCSPQGPFTGKHVVYAMPESNSFTVPGLALNAKLKEHLVVYNPHIHTQLSDNGRLLISYNLNRSHNADTIYIDGYRPRFIYVPIAGLK
jgi:hypothetical protein